MKIEIPKQDILQTNISWTRLFYIQCDCGFCAKGKTSLSSHLFRCPRCYHETFIVPFEEYEEIDIYNDDLIDQFRVEYTKLFYYQNIQSNYDDFRMGYKIISNYIRTGKIIIFAKDDRIYFPIERCNNIIPSDVLKTLLFLNFEFDDEEGCLMFYIY